METKEEEKDNKEETRRKENDVDPQNVTLQEATTSTDRQSTTSTNTVPPSHQPERKIKTLVTRKHWTKEDEDIISHKASAIITGRIKATRINIFGTIRAKGSLRRIARRETEERLFEKIKTMGKNYQKTL